MIELKDRLYTSTEVAEILGVSLRSVYRYLEENKLNAEVKTATGRHRFTKKNILDFLYPDGVADSVPPQTAPQAVAQTSSVVTETPVVAAPVAPVVEPVAETVPVQPVVEELVPPVATEPVQPVQEAPVTQPAPEEPVAEQPQAAPSPAGEDPVDWLAKFREAAAKFKEESEGVSVSAEPAFVQDQAVTGIGGSVPEPTPPPAAPAPVVEQPKSSPVYYYRSGLGGLKDIAQNIDKSARNSDVAYAFTLHAGLSLYKPIQPFSLLHVYAKSPDKAFFEKMLQLVPAEESNAQLAVILSDDSALYASREEVHGLYVVSKKQLKRDVQDFDMAALAKESADILG